MESIIENSETAPKVEETEKTPKTPIEASTEMSKEAADSTYSLIESLQLTPDARSVARSSSLNAPRNIPLPELPELQKDAEDAAEAYEQVHEGYEAQEKHVKIKETKDHDDNVKHNPLTVYRLLHFERTKIKQASDIMSSTSYASLSTVGYGSLFLSYVTARAAARGNAPQIAKLSSNLKSLSSLTSDWRTFYRVWGTMGTVDWALDLLTNPDKDIVLRYCDYTQAIAGVLYQVLEDIAYLGSKKVLKLSAATETKLWVVSCYFWATHVFVEFARLARTPRTGDWNTRMLVNLAWLPLTIHWSTETGFLNDGQVGFLGSAAYLPTAINNWRAFFCK